MRQKVLSILTIISLFIIGGSLYAQGDLPYVSEDVTFTNDDIILAGTLTLPNTAAAPHPAVIVISGSGEQNRDGATEGFIEGYEPLRFLAEGLTPAGIAVLRYDECGIGGSTGEHASSTTADFATDVLAAFDYLTSRDDIDGDQIGLIGHSEGSNIVAYAAARNEDIAFVISMAGQAVNGYEVLVEQTIKGGIANGMTPEQVDAELAMNRTEWDMVLAEDWDALEAYTRERIAEFPVNQQPEPEILDMLIERQEVFAKNWFHFFMTYDPADDWRRIEVPILVIFAELDTQVTVVQNREPFIQALEDGSNSDYKVVTLEDTNHLFQSDVETGAPLEYMTLEPSFMPELMTLIREWVLAHITVE